jgi:hypothetical protein
MTIVLALAAAIGLAIALFLVLVPNGIWRVPETPARYQTLTGRHIVGYQGWFSCPQDAGGQWIHWFRGRAPDPEQLVVDMWPDVSALDADERCETGLRTEAGQPAALFSSQNTKTVARHFAWMKAHEIDGAALQRFVSQLGSPIATQRVDRVLDNVRAAAAQHNRGYFMMYDISGAPPAAFAAQLLSDWTRLVRERGLLADATYWRHEGRPVLAIWGLGFTDRPGTPQEALGLIRALRAVTPGGLTLIGGIPTHWRGLNRDSKPDPTWAEVYRNFDILSPWSVGRYIDEPSWQHHAENVIRPDVTEARRLGKGYLPVIYPGFSFRHGARDPAKFNLIPRRCGAFYWMQAREMRSLGIDMLYTAMFDEVDEATAIFKVVPTP